MLCKGVFRRGEGIAGADFDVFTGCVGNTARAQRLSTRSTPVNGARRIRAYVPLADHVTAE
jgi:hypothetical protein